MLVFTQFEGLLALFAYRGVISLRRQLDELSVELDAMLGIVFDRLRGWALILATRRRIAGRTSRKSQQRNRRKEETHIRRR
jgi:hypothetical protein